MVRWRVCIWTIVIHHAGHGEHRELMEAKCDCICLNATLSRAERQTADRGGDTMWSASHGATHPTAIPLSTDRAQPSQHPPAAAASHTAHFRTRAQHALCAVRHFTTRSELCAAASAVARCVSTASTSAPLPLSPSHSVGGRQEWDAGSGSGLMRERE